MPWTFAHPAAVLPLRRISPLRLNLAALIIGSLTPDFGYYINRFALASFAHTLPGSFLVCLPTGLFLLMVYYLSRKPVWFVLPQPHRGALQPFIAAPPPRRAAGLARAALSVLIGSWTHILWDSFTHRNGWAVRQWEFLDELVIRIFSAEFPAYFLLQHLSTVIGLASLILAYSIWLSRRAGDGTSWFSPGERWRYLLLALLLFVAFATAVPLAALAAGARDGEVVLRAFVFHAAVYAAVVFIPMLIVSSALCYATRGKS